MSRIRLKGKKRLKISGFKLILIIIFLLFIAIYVSLKRINMKVSPILLEYAELECRKIASIIINDSITSNLTENIDIDNLFLTIKNSEGEIKSIDFNTIIVNKLLTKVTTEIQKKLNYLEEGQTQYLNLNNLTNYDLEKLKKGIIYEIPSGVIFKNSLLSNIGPKIPVKLNLVGDIISYINTKITDYGINNALVEISIVLELTEQVLLPFLSDKIRIVISTPISLKMIQGNVPQFYSSGLNQNSSSFSLPIE